MSTNEEFKKVLVLYKWKLASLAACSPLHYTFITICMVTARYIIDHDYSLYSQYNLVAAMVITGLAAMPSYFLLRKTEKAAVSNITADTAEKYASLDPDIRASTYNEDLWPILVPPAISLAARGLVLLILLICMIDAPISLWRMLSAMMLTGGFLTLMGALNISRHRYARLGRIAKLLRQYVSVGTTIETHTDTAVRRVPLTRLLGNICNALYGTYDLLSNMLWSALAVFITLYASLAFFHSTAMIDSGASIGTTIITEMAVAAYILATLDLLRALHNSGQIYAAIKRNNSRHAPASRPAQDGQLWSPSATSHDDAVTQYSEVKFSNVSYIDENGKELLSKINIDIKPGCVAAIVTTSDSAKKLMRDLICQKTLPTSGTILLDGIDIRLLKDDKISLITSDIELYHGTLRQNISPKHNMDDSTFDEVVNITSLQTLANQIANKDGGIINPKFCTISKADLKLISFARAIINKLPIAVFDEPMVDIRKHQEGRSLTSIARQYMSFCTSIIITSNPSLIRDTDLIYIIHNGKVAEEGDHMSLINKGGIYANLYMQYFSGIRNLH